MPQIHSFEEANKALAQFYNNARTPYTLDAMRQLMAYLDNPQEKVRVVHIAGTSGKTSTAYYTAALLQANGKTTGLFVSPHVDQVNERLQINGASLPEAEYCAVLSEFLELIATAPVRPSYFELLAALAFWEFARRGIDFAVMEVGLGGLLDATNVVTRADKVCVITDIGLDHTEILGDTIEQIAAQKAGIIQPGNMVHMYQQGDDVMRVVSDKVADAGATLLAISPASVVMPANLPLFQQRNLGLAVSTVATTLSERHETLAEGTVRGAAQITVPARLERFTIQGKTVIVDGSHNQQKLHALVESLGELYPNQKIAALCGFVQGNETRWQGGLRELLPVCSQIVFTAFHGAQDVPKSSVDPQQIVKFCESLDFHDTTVVADPKQAFRRLLEYPEPVLLVTGSFYLLNHIRPLIYDMQHTD